ncbi:ADP-ribosylglycohydrolase family protein [Mesorhizobium sp. B2-5-3]|uniref:ADP-ribosylglycohydrolase family protein n=1 Tax=Mesorhizobium sp. B2-5-3 TaxID=2589927 RepID=UPI00112CF49B|nr:ADP-ribosylglycohydrolase family protein [Mesorhizobium sp. B2-5-3]TPK40993.1 hypothetical protein FJ867_03550 [Mesorhizobium sp. B2-5-3]
MTTDTQRKVTQSALWAAYGDALGFITELADADRILFRSGHREIERTVSWRRKVGSRPGVTVEFPAGTYSDDTQLRLATSRAIRADGSFDVAAFAKVELPAWSNYALGAGLSSREAAANLARTSATWYSNFFSSRRSDYLNAGGNGAAMRIQPHVWSMPLKTGSEQLTLNVIKNTICTHGHARAIVGACYHAHVLHFALANARPPKAQECFQIVERFSNLTDIVTSDQDLRLLWLGQWESKVGKRFADCVNVALSEMQDDLERVASIELGEPEQMYHTALAQLGAFDDATRGSATKTSIAASFLSEVYEAGSPEHALTTAANSLGSDTDSIATMAGAILGACTREALKHPLQDRRHIEADAQRLAATAEGISVPTFGYPDLRGWKPERAAVDAILATKDGLVLNGIGRLTVLSSESYQESDGISLRWFLLNGGQTILGRTRDVPTYSEDASDNVVSARSSVEAGKKRKILSPKLKNLFADRTSERPRSTANPDQQGTPEPTLNETLQMVIASKFDARLIGEALLEQADAGHPDFVERGIAMVANILTAYEARGRKRG